MAQLTVGLDLGSEMIKRVRLRSSFRTVEVADFTAIPIPKDERPRRERLAEALRELQASSHPSDFIATALPGDEVSIRVLRLPFTDRKKIDQTIGFELESQIPFPLESVVYDHCVTGVTPEGESRLLVALCQQVRMEGWSETFKNAGMDPRLVGPDSAVYGSLQQFLPEPEQGSVAIIDIGHRLTSVCILGTRGAEFARTLSVGGADVTQQLATSLRTDPQAAEDVKRRDGFVESASTPASSPEQVQISDAISRSFSGLVREIRQTFASHQTLTQIPIQKVWLCGGGAAIPNLDGYLAEQLGIPVEPVRPDLIELPGMEALVQASPSPTAWVKPLALALHAHQGGRRGFLNLRRGRFSFQGDLNFLRSKIIYVAVGLAILLLLAVGHAVTRSISLSKIDRTLDERTREITQAILGKTEENLDRAVSIIREKTSPEANPIPKVTAMEVLQVMHERVPDGIQFRLKTLDISPKKVKLSGLVDTFESVEKVKAALEGYKCFTSVQTGRTQKTHDGSSVEFDFTIAFGC